MINITIVPQEFPIIDKLLEFKIKRLQTEIEIIQIEINGLRVNEGQKREYLTIEMKNLKKQKEAYIEYANSYDSVAFAKEFLRKIISNAEEDYKMAGREIYLLEMSDEEFEARSNSLPLKEVMFRKEFTLSKAKTNKDFLNSVLWKHFASIELETLKQVYGEYRAREFLQTQKVSSKINNEIKRVLADEETLIPFVNAWKSAAISQRKQKIAKAKAILETNTHQLLLQKLTEARLDYMDSRETLDKMEEIFGKRPKGIWPPEHCVSAKTLEMTE